MAYQVFRYGPTFRRAPDLYGELVGAVTERMLVSGRTPSYYYSDIDWTDRRNCDLDGGWQEVFKLCAVIPGLCGSFLDPDEPFVLNEQGDLLNNRLSLPEDVPDLFRRDFRSVTPEELQFYLDLLNRMYIVECHDHWTGYSSPFGGTRYRTVAWNNNNSGTISETPWQLYGRDYPRVSALFSHSWNTNFYYATEAVTQLRGEIGKIYSVNGRKPVVHAFSERLPDFQWDPWPRNDMGTGLAIGEKRETVISDPEEGEVFFQTAYFNLPQDTTTQSDYRYGDTFRVSACADYSDAFTFFA